ncbi:hypothetical protein [Burkholderia thailandensis]|uniref:hypothetical protein n=1 Tax=Burkholderia thailandensis TaxID=57975 RepID=UPI0012D2B633|nr:hypothetical protein [Burkholderia thailandensis]MCZ2896425.1 hypothetical protein [Burkholderia thailandensis]
MRRAVCERSPQAIRDCAHRIRIGCRANAIAPCIDASFVTAFGLSSMSNAPARRMFRDRDGDAMRGAGRRSTCVSARAARETSAILIELHTSRDCMNAQQRAMIDRAAISIRDRVCPLRRDAYRGFAMRRSDPQSRNLVAARHFESRDVDGISRDRRSLIGDRPTARHCAAPSTTHSLMASARIRKSIRRN